MKCLNCNKPVGNTDNFCQYCGENLKNKPKEIRNKSNGRPLSVTIAAIIIALAAIGSLLWGILTASVGMGLIVFIPGLTYLFGVSIIVLIYGLITLAFAIASLWAANKLWKSKKAGADAVIIIQILSVIFSLFNPLSGYPLGYPLAFILIAISFVTQLIFSVFVIILLLIGYNDLR